MGRYKSLAKITGAWADVQLCADGTARRKSSLTKKKWRKSPKMELSRESAKAFGGASAAGGAIIKNLPEEMRRLARSHSHNHIAAPLRRYNDATGLLTPEAYTFEAALPALYRLDISQNRILSQRIFVRTIGDPLQPKAIHIQGLRDAADTITPLPDHRLQFCLHFCFVEFPEARLRMGFEWYIKNHPRSHPQPSTGWLSADLIPEAGIKMALETPDPDEPQILFLGVEWRQVPNRSTRKQRLRPCNNNPAQVHTQSASTVIQSEAKDLSSEKKPTPKQAAELSKGYGILKIAALFRPTKDLDNPRPPFLQKGSTKKYRPTIKPRSKVNLTNMTPEQKLHQKMPTLGGSNPNHRNPSKIGFISPKKKPVRQSHESTQDPIWQPYDHAAIGGLLEPGAPNLTQTPEAPRHTLTPSVDGPMDADTPNKEPEQHAATPLPLPACAEGAPSVHCLQTPTTPVASSVQFPYTPYANPPLTRTNSTHSAHIHHIISTYHRFHRKPTRSRGSIAKHSRGPLENNKHRANSDSNSRAGHPHQRLPPDTP